MKHDKDLLPTTRQLVDTHFSCLRRTVRKNLSRLTCAFLQLAWSVRFGYGGLHLTSIARVLPEGKKFKSTITQGGFLPQNDSQHAFGQAGSVKVLTFQEARQPFIADQTTVNGVEV